MDTLIYFTPESASTKLDAAGELYVYKQLKRLQLYHVSGVLR